MPFRIAALLVRVPLSACTGPDPAPGAQAGGRAELESLRRNLERSRREVLAWTRH